MLLHLHVFCNIWKLKLCRKQCMDLKSTFMRENRSPPDCMNCLAKIPMEKSLTCTGQLKQQSIVTVNCLKVQISILVRNCSMCMRWLWISIPILCLQMSLGNCSLQEKVFQENISTVLRIMPKHMRLLMGSDSIIPEILLKSLKTGTIMYSEEWTTKSSLEV